MNLHEQYAELLARGMSEHPRLSMGRMDYWLLKVCTGREYWVWEPDARAIITMHAIDWLPTIGLELAQDGSEWVCYRVLEAKRFGTVKQEASRAPTILVAILAATEHLTGPQQPADAPPHQSAKSDTHQTGQ